MDARHPGAAEAKHADVVIVGGGAVGLTMAVDLARSGRSVIVLEAGGRDVDAASQSLIEAASWRGYPLLGLHEGRIRALGGTTNRWAGQLVEFEPIVFEERSWLGAAAWPIAATELTEFHGRALDLLGLQRRLGDGEVWRRLSVTPPETGLDLVLFMSRWAPENRLARFFARDIARSRHLQVFVNAPVVALSSADDGTIDGLVVQENGDRHSFAGKHVVLACGTVEIARLLSLPLADGRTAAWSGLPWLGRGFVDHLDAFAGDVTVIDRHRFHALFDSGFVDGLKYKPKIRLSESAQRRDRSVGIVGDFVFGSDFLDALEPLKNFARSALNRRLDPALAHQLLNDPRHIRRFARVLVPMAARYLRHGRTYNPGDGGIRLRLSTEQKPLRESGLRLLEKTDRLGMPLVEVDWRVDGCEVETMASFSEHVVEMLERTGLAKVELDQALVSRSPSFLARIDDANHHMGMARMGHDAKDGVVDRNLRVFGTRNLYVAGAATFPSTGFANPTLTAIALGLRLNRHIGNQD